MFEFNDIDALILSSLSYFDVLDFKEPLSVTDFAHELLVSPKSVSYTHLDVYKRQVFK